MSDTIELGDGRWKVVVAPALGGSLLACERDGIAVLLPTAQPAGGGRPAMRCCHFPLIPFSNRVEDATFRFGDATVHLARNVAGSPHAMHGHGWQSVWQVTGQSRTSCTLIYQREKAADWPWSYRGRHTLTVVDDALRLTLAVENLGSGAMPCGLGFHPFLPRARGARLTLAATQVWDGSAGAFPGQRVAVPEALDFRDGPHIEDRQGTDHCFDGWRGRATVGYQVPARALHLDGCEATRLLIVYIPQGADYFCLEPVTHAVNAMNLPDAAASGLWTLQPQETREVTMTIRALDTAGGTRSRG